MTLDSSPPPASASASRRTARDGWVPAAAAALWVILFLGARGVLDQDLVLPTWVKLTAALVPVLPTAFFLRAVVLGVRRLDELHRRVHLEALVIAYPLAILLLMTLGLLELAIDLSPDDWSYRHVWPFLVMFYFLGIALSWRRYK